MHRTNEQMANEQTLGDKTDGTFSTYTNAEFLARQRETGETSAAVDERTIGQHTNFSYHALAGWKNELSTTLSTFNFQLHAVENREE